MIILDLNNNIFIFVIKFKIIEMDINEKFTDDKAPKHYYVDRDFKEFDAYYYWVPMKDKTAKEVLIAILERLDNMPTKLNYLDELTDQVEKVLWRMSNFESALDRLKRKRNLLNSYKNPSKKKQIEIFYEMKNEIKTIISFDVLKKFY